jgi:hypothetical protein
MLRQRCGPRLLAAIALGITVVEGVHQACGGHFFSRGGASSHLRVLRAVGLVDVSEQGRQRLYRVNGRPLEEIHTWVRQYQSTWASGSTGSRPS